MRRFPMILAVLLVNSAHAELDVQQLVEAAKERTKKIVIYDGGYRKLDYPMGDVPENIGVCTDVIIRSLRKVGLDLQQAVHEDMRENFALYPANWGLTRPDSNIDHRRVPNLEVYFSRFAETLPATRDAEYKAGDIVSWRLKNGLPHIGILVDRDSNDGRRPLVVHNIGAGVVMEDVLFEYQLVGHFRLK
ncbi:DUF1287 domain-containing protein [Pleionea litopenaei]|uniref:DUF1287 domain-containing protein n=1 Tax=Pleionea litopenaei TaxID=3070815 RepID=A0AA51RR19_9GAMM|nr:DUF1287 domain-containing protein [Pleionea sp. HL-JVS1]WMS85970.1 DUF1287 domain-containing protein [Pleionea sp. HL-JVS1]